MFKSILLLIIAMLSVQYSASVAKGLFNLVGAAGASTLRLIFASFIMAIIFRPWKTKFTRENIKALIFYGGSLGLMNLTFYIGLQRIPLGVAVALEFIGPLAVAIIYSRKTIDVIWAILAGVGIWLLLPLENTPDALDPWGVCFALLAGVFWGLYIIFGKRAGNHLSGGVASSMGMVVAALFVLPWGIILEHERLLTWEAWPLGILIGVVGSALPYSLEMFALKTMPARTFGILMSLEPAIAALMGIVFLSESLSLTQWIAMGCVMASSAGSTVSAQKS